MSGWIPFPRELSIPSRLTLAGQQELSRIFSSHGPWQRALGLLGLEPTENVEWIRLENNEAYFHHDALVSLLKRRSFLALLKSQWSIERFLSERAAPSFQCANATDACLTESLALGIALLSLTLRLPTHDADQFDRWLALPEECPRIARRTIASIVAAQRLRSMYTPTWTEHFAPYALPEAMSEARDTLKSHSARIWRGRLVCAPPGGLIEGAATWISDPHRLPTSAEILVFARAIPDSVLGFSGARAVLFGHGSSLSHACIVARERNLPCLTALGDEFLAAIRESSHQTVRVDFDRCTVELF